MARATVLYQYTRESIGAPVMSASSGPKDYLKNQAWDLLVEHAGRRVVLFWNAERIGSPFCLIQLPNRSWIDPTGVPYKVIGKI